MSTFNDLLIEIGLDTRPAYKGIKKLDKAFSRLGKAFEEAMDEGSNSDPYGLKKQKKDFEKFQDEVNKERIRDQKASIKKQERLKKEAKLRDRNLDITKQIEKITGKSLKIDSTLPIEKQNKLLEKQLRLVKERNKRAAHFRLAQQSRQSFKALPQKEQDRVMGRFEEARMNYLRSGDTLGFKALSEDVKTFKRQLIGLQTVQGGLTDSTRNMIRAYASLFALIEGTQAIKSVGMDFQQMEAGMLVASKNAEEVGKNMEFVSKHAERLGMNLVDSTKAFVRIGAAAKGKIKKEDLEDLFLGIAEGATVMQLSMDDTTGALRAVQQIIQKGQVYAKSSLALHTVMYVE